MEHSYIVSEGKWKTKGLFIDENNETTPITGQTIISQLPDHWILDGYMEIQSERSIRHYNKYRIQPMSPTETSTAWESSNPGLGLLKGQFVFINDTILSFWHSEDYLYQGSEVLILKDENTYHNRGVLFLKNHRLSSWEAELTKINN